MESPIRRMCHVLDVGPSGYYGRRGRAESGRGTSGARYKWHEVFQSNIVGTQDLTPSAPLRVGLVSVRRRDAQWVLGKTTYTDTRAASGNASPIKLTRWPSSCTLIRSIHQEMWFLKSGAGSV